MIVSNNIELLSFLQKWVEIYYIIKVGMVQFSLTTLIPHLLFST